MGLGRRLRSFWRNVIRRSDMEQNLSDEVQFHLERRANDLMRRHELSPEEAQRMARREFGSVDKYKEQTRQSVGLRAIDEPRADLRHAWRTMWRQRSYLLMMVSTLGLTVGVNLVVFTIVNALWLKKPTFPNVDRTVVVLGDETESSSGSGESRLFGSLDLFHDSGAFDAVAGQASTSGPTNEAFLPRLQFEQIDEEIETLGVTSTYFDVLGLSVLGRTFAEDDDRPGAEAVAILSDQLWTQYFSRRSEVIGAVVPAMPFDIRIIGVAPAGFQGARLGERTDVWVPRHLSNRLSVNSEAPPSLLVFGRLRDGLTIPEAEQRVAAVVAALNATRRAPSPRQVLVPIADVFGSPHSRTFVVREQGATALVTFLSGLVLLAGAATLMALVLVHYERRRQELSLRLALGASRARLVRQLAVELLLLVAIGCGVAVLVAAGGLRALPALSLPGGADLARLDLSIDWRVLAIGVVLSVATIGLAALVPVRRFTRGDLARDLVTTAGMVTLASHRLRRTLLGIEVAATVVVLMTAALFVRAVLSGFSTGPGFDVERTAFVRVPLTQGMLARTPPIAELNARMERFAQTGTALFAGIASLPGVDSVSRGAPPIGPDQARLISRRSVTTEDSERDVSAAMIQVGPEYLGTIGVPMVLGRSLTAADTVAVYPRPTVVTASLARSLWPDRSPLGQTFSLQTRGGPFTVVGIAADFRFGSATGEAAGVVVVPLQEIWGGVVELAVRADRPETLVEPIRQRIASLAPDVRRIEVVSGRELMTRDLGRQRLGAWFFSGFGLVALVLAVGGVFGLVAYLAEARQREFGVRLALGATSNDLIRHAISTTLMPIAVGAACGLATAAILARSFSALLVGISPLDPLSYAAVGILTIGSAALAGFFAASRLRGLSPSTAFRSE